MVSAESQINFSITPVKGIRPPLTCRASSAHPGLQHADVVVSGLPWAAFGEGQQRDALAAVAALPPHGVFTTFAYVLARWAPPAEGFVK
jgi:phosphatidylethanolamine/phosphatidyl-N-methylethanolamine N-methyltransferase